MAAARVEEPNGSFGKGRGVASSGKDAPAEVNGCHENEVNGKPLGKYDEMRKKKILQMVNIRKFSDTECEGYKDVELSYIVKPLKMIFSLHL